MGLFSRYGLKPERRSGQPNCRRKTSGKAKCVGQLWYEGSTPRGSVQAMQGEGRSEFEMRVLSRGFVTIGCLFTVAAQESWSVNCAPLSQYGPVEVWETVHSNCTCWCPAVPIGTHPESATVHTTLRGRTCCYGGDCCSKCFETVAKSQPDTVSWTFVYPPGAVIECGGKVVERLTVVYDLNQDPDTQETSDHGGCANYECGCVLAYYHNSWHNWSKINQQCTSS